MNASTALTNLRPIWILGAEDIAVDHSSGWAYISSQSRPPGIGALFSKQQGAIFGLDLKQDRPQPINLTDDLFASQFPSEGHAPGREGERRVRAPLVRPDGAFHPSGISLFPHVSGAKRLFAVNSRSSTHKTVEIFDIAKASLTHVRTVEDDLNLISPNDLVAVGDEQFYVTNDHAFSNVLLQYVENAFRYSPHFHSGSISYFDGKEFTTVARGLSFPNGIAVSRESGRIYVASVLGRKVLVADWNEIAPSKELSFSDGIALPSFPDNLKWDLDGNLWVGAHSDFDALGLYTIGLRATSPSSVLRIRDFRDRQPLVEEIWADSGVQLSSSSVAGFYQREDGRNLLLIGAAFDDHMLIGELQAAD